MKTGTIILIYVILLLIFSRRLRWFALTGGIFTIYLLVERSLGIT